MDYESLPTPNPRKSGGRLTSTAHDGGRHTPHNRRDLVSVILPAAPRMAAATHRTAGETWCQVILPAAPRMTAATTPHSRIFPAPVMSAKENGRRSSGDFIPYPLLPDA